MEPSLSSLNTGDCFILVTTKELFCWIGKYANTIEKAKVGNSPVISLKSLHSLSIMLCLFVKNTNLHLVALHPKVPK